MANHVHLVVVAGEALPTGKVIGDFKAYSTRRLNAEFGRRGRWWTERGSGRLLPDDRAVGRAVAYVLSQERPLVVWAAG
jgi:REP element-mobilizing transposase RayT